MNKCSRAMTFAVLAALLLVAQQSVSVPPPCLECKCKEYHVWRTGAISDLYSLGKVADNTFSIVPHAVTNVGIAGPIGKQYASLCDIGPRVKQTERYDAYSWPANVVAASCNIAAVNPEDILENENPPPGSIPVNLGLEPKTLHIKCTQVVQGPPPPPDPDPVPSDG